MNGTEKLWIARALARMKFASKMPSRTGISGRVSTTALRRPR